MPLPAVLLPIAQFLASAGIAIGTNRKNVKSQKETNRQNRLFTKQMYQRQFDDSQKIWSQQNAYNHPKQQMERLRQAGLNPNLVYGKGADNTAQSIQRSSPQSHSDVAPQHDLSGASNAFMDFQNVRSSQAQTDNLYAQNSVLQQEALLKAAQTNDTLNTSDRKKFDLELQRELRDITIDQAKIDLALTSGKDELQDIQVEKIKQEVNLIKQKVVTESQQRKINEFEIKLNQSNLTKNDSRYWRIMADFMSELGIDTKSILKLF